MRSLFVSVVLLITLASHSTALLLPCKLWGPLLRGFVSNIPFLRRFNAIHHINNGYSSTPPTPWHAVDPVFRLSQYYTNEGGQQGVRLSASILTKPQTPPFTGSIEVDIVAEDLPSDDTRQNAEFGKPYISIVVCCSRLAVNCNYNVKSNPFKGKRTDFTTRLTETNHSVTHIQVMCM